ncbi:MAG: hypothetical protein QOH09_1983 [Pseudonocardiales bacterium]|jgi:hypothetical protein|nr:hypothetical protein [Pseudonocardiales bacterium]MDT7715991.1 hypothetical protein [Pseudonocardiales bacterium]
MRVSAIFAQGGGHHGGDDCDRGCDYGCDDYFSRRGSHYYNGYNDRHYNYGWDRDHRGLLADILGAL